MSEQQEKNIEETSGSIEPWSPGPDKIFVWHGIIMPNDFYLGFQLIPVERLKAGKRRGRIIPREDFDLIPKLDWTPEAIEDIRTSYFPCVVYALHTTGHSDFVMVPTSELERVGMLDAESEKP